MTLQQTDTVALLRPDNFTPPSRTPWGGGRIARLKGIAVREPVGESWELSVEPSFPSRCVDGELLSARLARAPDAWLGGGDASLLVKLLDARDPLSVQIHPPDDYARLAPDESGKPESWYVIACDPGAGLHFGLAPHATERAMREAIAHGADVSALLSFVPIEPGDFLVIDAGTPHCIGAGVTLIEPQRVRPGRRGVTYRYWDWERAYDAEGRLDPHGERRPLHVEEALAVTAWDAPRGEALLARARVRAGAADREGRARIDRLGEAALRVARVHGTGAIERPAWDRLVALTVVEGRVQIGDVTVPAGYTAAIAAVDAQPLVLDRAHAILAATD